MSKPSKAEFKQQGHLVWLCVGETKRAYKLGSEWYLPNGQPLYQPDTIHSVEPKAAAVYRQVLRVEQRERKRLPQVLKPQVDGLPKAGESKSQYYNRRYTQITKIMVDNVSKSLDIVGDVARQGLGGMKKVTLESLANSDNNSRRMEKVTLQSLANSKAGPIANPSDPAPIPNANTVNGRPSIAIPPRVHDANAVNGQMKNSSDASPIVLRPRIMIRKPGVDEYVLIPAPERAYSQEELRGLFNGFFEQACQQARVKTEQFPWSAQEEHKDMDTLITDTDNKGLWLSIFRLMVQAACEWNAPERVEKYWHRNGHYDCLSSELMKEIALHVIDSWAEHIQSFFQILSREFADTVNAKGYPQEPFTSMLTNLLQAQQGSIDRVVELMGGDVPLPRIARRILFKKGQKDVDLDVWKHGFSVVRKGSPKDVVDWIVSNKHRMDENASGAKLLGAWAQQILKEHPSDPQLQYIGRSVDERAQISLEHFNNCKKKEHARALDRELATARRLRAELETIREERAREERMSMRKEAEPLPSPSVRKGLISNLWQVASSATKMLQTNQSVQTPQSDYPVQERTGLFDPPPSHAQFPQSLHAVHRDQERTGLFDPPPSHAQFPQSHAVHRDQERTGLFDPPPSHAQFPQSRYPVHNQDRARLVDPPSINGPTHVQTPQSGYAVQEPAPGASNLFDHSDTQSTPASPSQQGRTSWMARFFGSPLEAVADEESEPKTDSSFSKPCSICICDIMSNEDCRKIMPCGHIFHAKCLQPLLNGESGLCPNCRGPIDRLKKYAFRRVLRSTPTNASHSQLEERRSVEKRSLDDDDVDDDVGTLDVEDSEEPATKRRRT